MSIPYRIPSIKNKLLQDPHVVIIGAGASKASCPKDKNGKQVPLLKNILEAINMKEELASYGFSNAELEDFEKLYSKIYNQSNFYPIQLKLEKEVANYFRQLVIPDDVTLYDFLILSLTKKDAIISFNWDPFLIQAYKRNRKVGNLPQIFFPHGNTGVGLCYSCNRKGYVNSLCEKCFSPLENMKLLFPVENKDYYDGSIIESEWECAKDFLRRAAGLTIWGYGAPISDKEAYLLIKESFKTSAVGDIAPLTIINLPSNEQQEKEKWKDIFSERMFSYVNDFRESILWKAPRVSLEMVYDAILLQNPRTTQSFQMFKTLKELQNFIASIDDFELSV